MHGTPEKLIEPDSAVLSATCTCVVTLPLCAGIAQSDVPALALHIVMFQLWNETELCHRCRFDLNSIFPSTYSMLMGGTLVGFSWIPPDLAVYFPLEQVMLVLHCAVGS